MINRHPGQIRIGRSGPIVIGEQPDDKQVTLQESESPKVAHRKRSEKVKRRSSRITHQERRDRNKRKMRANLSDEVIDRQIDEQIIEESQITRHESTKFVRPAVPIIDDFLDGSATDNGGDITDNDGDTIDDDIIYDDTIHKISKKTHKDRIVEKFDRLTKENKAVGRHWYYGLEGKWWWGMSEDDARRYIVEPEFQQVRKKELSKKELSKKELNKKELNKKSRSRRTIGEIIDEMTAKYYKELPEDSMNRISYIYPVSSTHSFNIVAVNHIKYLRHKYIVDNKDIEIEEIDWSRLGNIDWEEKRSVLIHPFLYPFASYDSFMQNSRSFAKLLATKHKIGGFDVADSSKISKIAVDLINKIDLMIVPSNFARDTYINSGVTIPVEVLPHGIPDEFLGDYPVHTDNIEITKLRRMKDKGNILILYFLVHSSHRKGADLVREVMKRVQNKYSNVYLVVKSKDIEYFSKVRSICLESWMSNDDLRLLYDTCDICLSPSRGGGFEMNALEAVSRGLPTLVTNGGCFLDLIDYFIPIDLSNNVTQSLPGNVIHTGLGNESDIDDFERKLVDVISRLDYWKAHFKGNISEIREKYTWRNITKMLDDILIKYDFIQ